MSIRIHGYRFPLPSPAELTRICAGVIESCRSIGALLAAEYVLQSAVKLFDVKTESDGSKTPDFAEILNGQLRDFVDRVAQVEQTRRRDPQIDFDLTFTIHEHEGQGYVVAMCDDPRVLHVLTSALSATPYSWSNAVDCGLETTQEEWRNRERVWTAILAPEWIPGKKGQVYEAYPEGYNLSEQQILAELENAAIENFDARVDYCVRMRRVSDRFQTLKSTTEMKGFGAFFDAMKFVDDEKSTNAPAYLSAKEAISKTLVPATEIHRLLQGVCRPAVAP